MKRKANRVFKQVCATLGVAFTLFSLTGVARAADVNDVLFAAIRDGSASSTVSGKVADFWKSKTRSASPLLVSAKVLNRFPMEKDCARLSITMHQENVPKKDGSLVPFGFTYYMNLCTDGMPPSEGVNWEAAPIDAPAARPEDIQ
jgi:hypothetical protein